MNRRSNTGLAGAWTCSQKGHSFAVRCWGGAQNQVKVKVKVNLVMNHASLKCKAFRVHSTTVGWLSPKIIDLVHTWFYWGYDSLHGQSHCIGIPFTWAYPCSNLRHFFGFSLQSFNCSKTSKQVLRVISLHLSDVHIKSPRLQQ